MMTIGDDDRQPRPVDEDARKHGSSARLDFGRLHDLTRPDFLDTLGNDFLTCRESLRHCQARAEKGPVSTRRTSTLLALSTIRTKGPP